MPNDDKPAELIELHQIGIGTHLAVMGDLPTESAVGFMFPPGTSDETIEKSLNLLHSKLHILLAMDEFGSMLKDMNEALEAAFKIDPDNVVLQLIVLAIATATEEMADIYTAAQTAATDQTLHQMELVNADLLTFDEAAARFKDM